MVTAAKRLLPTLLLSVTFAGAGDEVVRDEALHFEIRLPAELDWERIKVDPKTGWKAHFQTSFAGAPADVLLMVVKDTRPDSLAEAAARRRATIEHGIEVESRKTRRAQLAGTTWLVTEVRGGGMALDWWIARRDDHVYLLYERRLNQAVSAAPVRKEIARIRETFRFLGARKPPPKPEPKPEPIPKKTYRLGHWRLECTKPQGWREVTPDATEKANDVILKFDAKAEQTRCVVRVYAQARSHPRHVAIGKLVDRILDRFAETYEKREPPEKSRWKVPLGRRALQLRLTGLRRTPETIRWYLAECRNGRQYRIEIHVLGAEGPWRAACDEFLAEFAPKKRLP